MPHTKHTTPDHCTTSHNPTTTNPDSLTTTTNNLATINTPNSRINYNPVIYLTANNLYWITVTTFNATSTP